MNKIIKRENAGGETVYLMVCTTKRKRSFIITTNPNAKIKGADVKIEKKPKRAFESFNKEVALLSGAEDKINESNYYNQFEM